MQHVGLISMAAYWLVVGYILLVNYTGPADPISDYVKAGRSRQLYLAVSTVSFTLFYIFYVLWLFPEYDLPVFAYGLLSISFMLQLATSFVPRTTKKKAYIHDWTARLSGTMAVLLLPFFALSDRTPIWLSYVLWIMFVAALAVGTYIRSVNRRNFLPLQISLFGTFYLLIVVLTYTA